MAGLARATGDTLRGARVLVAGDLRPRTVSFRVREKKIRLTLGGEARLASVSVALVLAAAVAAPPCALVSPSTLGRSAEGLAEPSDDDWMSDKQRLRLKLLRGASA